MKDKKDERIKLDVLESAILLDLFMQLEEHGVSFGVVSKELRKKLKRHQDQL